ncbi:MAG: MauE/DoxX family redox-associated membrane protein [Acidobacteriota bacterium]
MGEIKEKASAWSPTISYLGALALGGVLLVAAWTKLLDPMSFAEQIELEGLDFLLSAPTVAFIALALEVGLGFALVIGLRKLSVLVPTSLLVVFFLWLTGRNWYLVAQGLRDESAACGCFGNLVQRTPAEAFWQDLILLVPPLLLAWWGRGLPKRWIALRAAAAVVVTIGALIFAVKAPDLPLDDLATRLSPGVEVGSLCAGADAQKVCLDTLVPELAQGEHLVVISSLEEENFLAQVDTLTFFSLDNPSPRIWVVSAAEVEERQAFSWKYGPAFEIRDVPEALLKPLYRSLPRSFRVVDGTVTETWRSVPPLNAAEVGSSEGSGP